MVEDLLWGLGKWVFSGPFSLLKGNKALHIKPMNYCACFMECHVEVK